MASSRTEMILPQISGVVECGKAVSEKLEVAEA